MDGKGVVIRERLESMLVHCVIGKSLDMKLDRFLGMRSPGEVIVMRDGPNPLPTLCVSICECGTSA